MFKLKELPTHEELIKFQKEYSNFNENSLLVFLNILKKGSQLLIKLDSYLNQFELLHGRFITLMILERSINEKETISTIAEKQDVKKPTMTRILSSLQDIKLVKIFDCPDDGRSKKVNITSKGKKLLADIMPGYYSLINDTCTNLTKKDLVQLSYLIEKLEIE